VHWVRRHRFVIHAAICACCTLLILLGRQFPGAPFISAPWRGEQAFEDLLRREGYKTPTRSDFVLLGIDQSTLQMPPFLPEELAHNRALQLMTERPFPWSREVWALLLDKLFGAGARLVMFDLIFNNPNDGDPAFAAAIAKYHDRVVLGANIDAMNDNQIILPNATLIPPPAEKDPRVGLVNFWPDPVDLKVRAAAFSFSERQLAGLPPYPGEEVFESFAARALTLLGHGADVPRDERAHLIRFSAVNAYPPKTLYEVFDPKLWRTNFQNGAFFKDKVVVIGATSQVMHDVVDTPMSPTTLGPALHLETMAAVLGHQFLHATPPPIMLVLVLAGGLGAWVLVALTRRPILRLFLLVSLSAGYLIITRVAYDQTGLLLLTVPVLSTFLTGGTFSLGFEYVLERMETVRTRRTLERYVSKNLVKEILDNPDSFYSNLKGVRIPATVLFSDIVGFTSLSEHADPEALVRQLNEYLSRMTAAVFEHGGTLDKFIGDAVMAVWGNVSSKGEAEDARAAARAALMMRRELRELNTGWHAQGIAPFAIGIGINQGDVVVGNIGSHEKADPTVIGDAVNLASRLEGLTRTYGVDIILGPTATEFARKEFHVRSLARVQVKGKSEPVEISFLIGGRDEAIDPEWLRHLETYEEAFVKFRERDFRSAKILLSRFLEFYPQDHIAKIYLERALEYETTPPDDAWNAVEVFKKK
jgi:adenylate cyclase